MPDYASYAAGSNPGYQYGTYATQSGPDAGSNGGDSTASGLPYNANLETWLPPGGFWNDPSYLLNRDAGIQAKVAKQTGAGNPTSRYLNPGGTPITPQPPGTVPVPGAPGQYINPNDPNQRYQPVNISKSADVNAAEPTLMDEFKKGASDSLSGFDDYLSTFKNALNDAFSATKKANDPSATIATLNKNQATYDAGLTQDQADYKTLNENTAAAERGVVTDAQALLPSYDQAADAAAGLAMDKVTQQVNRYKAGGGAPTGLSSGEQQLMQSGDAQILVPLEQAKINKAYDILSQYKLPVEQDIANRETNRIAQFTPQVLAQQFQSGQATAQTIQALLSQTAQMSMQDATQYMQALGVPAEVQQKILSGQISQLGAINTLEDQSNYRGLRDVLGANVTPSVGYSAGTGAFPTPSRYAPGGGNPQNYNPQLGGSGPTTTGTTPPGAPPGAVGNFVWDSNNRRWQNWQTGQAMPQGFNPTQSGGAGGEPGPTNSPFNDSAADVQDALQYA